MHNRNVKIREVAELLEEEMELLGLIILIKMILKKIIL